MAHKDIFDLFRASEPKLEQKPSRHAWRKLESRLDAQRNRHRVSVYRQIAAAAAAVAIIAMVMVASMLVQDRGANTQMAMADTVLPTEDLYQYEKEGNVHTIVVSQKIYHNNTIIAEGQPGKKLQLINQSPSQKSEVQIATEPPQSIVPPSQIATADIVWDENDATEMPIAANTTRDVVTLGDAASYQVIDGIPLPETEVVSEEMEMKENTMAIREAEVEETEPHLVIRPKTDKVIEDMDIGQADTREAQRIKEQLPDPLFERTEENTTYEDMVVADEVMDKTTTASHLSKKAKSKQRTTTAQAPKDNAAAFNFDLLPGTWAMTLENGTSYTTWQKNTTHYTGNGYVVTKGDTIFSENMLIQQEGSSYSLYINTDASEKKRTICTNI